MAEEKLTVMNDLGEIKTIDFVNKFSTNISELLKLLGVTRKEPLSADMKIRTYKWTTDIDTTNPGEGETIPLSKVTRALNSFRAVLFRMVPKLWLLNMNTPKPHLVRHWVG